MEEHLAAGSPEFYYIGSGSLVVNGGHKRVLNGFGGTRLSVAFPVGQTLGQTASFLQTAPETWCQSRVCGVSRPTSPKTVKHRAPADSQLGVTPQHALARGAK